VRPVWIAVSVYVLVAIVRKRLGWREPYNSQILSRDAFEKTRFCGQFSVGLRRRVWAIPGTS